MSGGTTGGTAPATGGTTSGGRASGGTASGGKASGGSAVGGSASGGKASGGSATGGSGGGSTLPKFILGADISSVDEAMDRGTRYADTDGTTKSIFDILKNHGFNFIRLRAFVKPGAMYGYAYGTGGSCVKSETYCDTAHTVAFAKQVKAAGMGFLLDLHYSDNWADPGNQIIPEDWRGATSVSALATYVKNYTQDVVSQLVSGGARPDMVQIGNETTPGMLVHVPNSNTDCWGNNVSTASVNGSTSNWTNLGTLLKAGVDGVKAVDGSIKIMIHIENTKSASGVTSWVRNAINQGVAIDVVGLSCYVAYQGDPSVWQNTFTTLASTFPNLSFAIAEYNPQRTAANQVMHDLPNGRGLGTFFWEPTQGGEWGTSMFTSSGGTMRANAADFQEFDTIRQNYGL
jgi:arabinogalactan endo-1,4-beta-galactosidase